MTEAATRLPLLARMQRDLHQGGALRPSTAATMWTAYGAHAVLTVLALRRGAWPLRLPGPVVGVGVLAAAGGVGLCAAGMGRFAGVEQLSGTVNEELTTSGVYRWSRNPQYLGYVLLVTGAAVARRSGAALLSATALGVVYRAWVPVEEQHLVRLHGADYRSYQERTRRWWGRA